MEFVDAVTAYDAASRQFDQMESEPAFGMVRQASLEVLKRTFHQGRIVVDIGCGTGTEAIALAKKGVTVVGIDPSRGMIEAASEKKRRARVENAYFYQLRACEVSQLPALSGFHRFDGAYSTLGSLNCEQTLEPVAQDLAQLLHPNSPVLLSLVNKHCAAEMFLYALSRPSRVFRRSCQFMPAVVGTSPVLLRLYSLREVKESFGGYRVTSVQALPFLVPPPHIGKRFPEDILQGLHVLDAAAARVWPLNRFGDYMVVVMTSP